MQLLGFKSEPRFIYLFLCLFSIFCSVLNLISRAVLFAMPVRYLEISRSFPCYANSLDDLHLNWFACLQYNLNSRIQRHNFVLAVRISPVRGVSLDMNSLMISYLRQDVDLSDQIDQLRPSFESNNAVASNNISYSINNTL